MESKLQIYFDALGKRESGGKYNIKNQLNYIGKYQMGEAALVDIGYYSKNIRSWRDYNNDWSGTFTGKNGVNSLNDFLENPEVQEKAILEYMKIQWGYIKNYAPKYSGQYINGIHITYSGMLAASHLVGHSYMNVYLSSKGASVQHDANKVSMEEYLKLFSDYDVSEITGLPDDSSVVRYDKLNKNNELSKFTKSENYNHNDSYKEKNLELFENKKFQDKSNGSENETADSDKKNENNADADVIKSLYEALLKHLDEFSLKRVIENIKNIVDKKIPLENLLKEFRKSESNTMDDSPINLDNLPKGEKNISEKSDKVEKENASVLSDIQIKSPQETSQNQNVVSDKSEETNSEYDLENTIKGQVEENVYLQPETSGDENLLELEAVPDIESLPELGEPTGEAAPIIQGDEDMSYEVATNLADFKRQWAEAAAGKSVYSQYPDIFGYEDDRQRKHPRPPLYANFEFREAVEFIIEDILRDFALIKGIELKDPYENWRTNK